MKIANILLLSVSVAALAACGKSQPDTANPDDAAAPVEDPATDAEPVDDMLDDEATEEETEEAEEATEEEAIE